MIGKSFLSPYCIAFPTLHSVFSLLIFFLVLTSAISLWGQTSPEPHQAGSVHGIVVNRVTHEPVARALVVSPDNRYATLTDAQGRFEFKLAETPAGAQVAAQPTDLFALTARKPGFLQTPDAMVNLRPDTMGRDITISLVPEAHIVGQVTLPSGETPDQLRVELFRRQVREGSSHWDQLASAAVKHSGEFRFADLAAGDYKLLTSELLDQDPVDLKPGAVQYGYPPVYYPNATDFASAKILTLPAGMTVEADMTLVRHAYYPIKVAVVNVHPGTGLGVTVSVQGRGGPGYALGYNIQTQTIEGMLPDGIYSLEATSYTQSAATGSTTISVRGAPVTGAQLALIPDGSIAVDVKEEFSAENTNHTHTVFSGRFSSNIHGPRSYLNVFLEPADDFGQKRGGALRGPTGRDDDALVIENVAPGHYWVRINSSRGFAASVTSGSIDLKHQPLLVGAGGTTSPVEITMRDQGAELNGTIDGLASSANGNPGQVRVYVVPLPDSDGEFREVWVAPDGKFQLQDIPPGAYLALAFDRPQRNFAYRDADAMREYEAQGIVLRLEPGQKTQVHLHLIGGDE